MAVDAEERDAHDLLRYQVGDQQNDHEGRGKGVQVTESAHGMSLSQEAVLGFMVSTNCFAFLLLFER